VKVLIALCFAVLVAVRLDAQENGRAVPDSSTPPETQPYRDPHRALVLGSLIPGAGHIYAGEYFKGFTAYEATVGSIGVGAMVFIWDKCMLSFLSTTRCESGPAWPHQLLGVAMVGAGIWGWISSARDAPRAAERANARHAAQSRTVTPIIDPFSESTNGPRIGLSLRW
jgi:hypothetical protein